MTTQHTLVLALGNPLRGDDGAGRAVLKRLLDATMIGTSNLPGVRLIDGGTPGLETAMILQGYQRVVIVDTVEMELVPGEWRRFTLEDATIIASDASMRGTLHDAGLAEALKLGQALDILPNELVIYGIQPQQIGWEEGLSAAVKEAVVAVSHAIVDELSGEV